MPRPELRGRLRYRGCGPGPWLSLLHVRVSAAAARALRGCGRRQGAPGPAIAFQGSRGCLTVPAGPGTPPRLFAFSLSRCSRDERGASFECARLAVPRATGTDGWEHCPGVRSHQSGSLPLFSSRSPMALAKQPGAFGANGVNGSQGQRDGPAREGLCRHVPESRNHRPATASPRASLQSLVQPRALRPFRKHELLRRLEGMPAGRRSGARLLAALEEVAELEPAACCCYPLKGALVPENWPGNTVQERQQAALLQRREILYHLLSGAVAEAYEAAFSADYTEYCNLHACIGNVSWKFIQLGAKMKMLKQGTEGFQALEATIVRESSHFKKTYPSYQQEKQRCEYLHQKLSHINSLILQFEGSGSS
ncbi:LOW QUALITY PROTEIN: RNA polymerase II elongation factor ELL3 [Aquila chrysaetos chrysaetos]|uniref:LOW QUALITY PROTEIN: RNA polymerase II elongation factor ELL3 n=1 Tax=Aquila chrysaetos chrysaetos TaxID=223781 RepID=UPI001B7D38B3|nr:LOW QUALITY PROTEIN: RNA polymerase II elongation factor ELL3 [Aquila chrysaetos chrysaetos]